MQVQTGGNSFLGAAAVFAAEGRPVVGEANGENLTPSFAPVTDATETPRAENPTRDPVATEKQTQDEPVRQNLRRERQQASDDVELRQEQQAAESRQTEEAAQEQLKFEQAQIQQLASRDREVRAHEQAHRSVGGQFAGPVSLDLTRGPDGRAYAVSGEVSISLSSVAGDPQATIAKLEQVQRAALAPAEPSSQDRQVAATAGQGVLEAQAQLQQQKIDEQRAGQEARDVASAEAKAEKEAEEKQRLARETDAEEQAMSAKERLDLINQRSRKVAQNLVQLDAFNTSQQSAGRQLNISA